MRSRALFTLWLLSLGSAGVVRAQDLDPAERQAAAEAAYDRGTRAYRGGDYAQAGRWYETANEMAPAAAALIQAIRAYQRADNVLRAGTLAESLKSEYGEERLGRYAGAVGQAEAAGVRVEVSCEECTIEVDGEREIFRTLFLAPDVAHTIVAVFADGRAEEEVRGAAGEQREVALVPPPPPEPIPPIDPGTTEGTGTGSGSTGGGGRGTVAPPPEDDGGISPAFFITGLVLTAGCGGLAAWSWVDTLDAAADYNLVPTVPKYDNGQMLELRTTLLVIGTGVLGATSLLLLFFTDWDGDEREVASARIRSIGAAPLPEGGAAVSVGGVF